MLSLYSYLEIINNKDKWNILEGGISNKIYKFNNYVVKVIEKKNDNLFLVLSNYYKILEKFDTTLYIDYNDNIIIEKYIEGEIISNEELFKNDFCLKIFDLIDNFIYKLNYDIIKENIIKKYINNLTDYLEENQIFLNEYIQIKEIVYPLIYKHFNNDDILLYFSHNDIHKYNIIISKDKLNFIDYEYSGYTWKYFDHCNFIVLLMNEIITQNNNISKENINEYFNLNFYLNILVQKYSNYSKEYFLEMMIISSYTWYLWSFVKYHLNKDTMYIDYSKQMKFIIEYLVLLL